MGCISDPGQNNEKKITKIWEKIKTNKNRVVLESEELMCASAPVAAAFSSSSSAGCCSLLRSQQLCQEQEDAEQSGEEGQLRPGLSAGLSRGCVRGGCWPPPLCMNLAAAASSSGDSGGDAVMPLLQACTTLQSRFQSVHSFARPLRLFYVQQSSFDLINCAYWWFLYYYIKYYLIF